MKLIKKIPITLIALALIYMGWKQEVFYYVFVFTGNGLEEPMAYIAGISLSILLGYFAYKKNYFLFGLLLTFSIVTTVIGQNQSYSVKQSEYNIDTVKKSELTDNKQYYLNEIQRVNSEITANNLLLPDNISDRAYLKTNGVDPILRTIEILKAEKKEYELLMVQVSGKLSTGTKQNTAFENIAKDIPFLSPTLLKYGFQVFMSLFIALMAPSGIRILSTAYSPAGEAVVKKPKKEKAVESDGIDEFANERFRHDENPPTLLGRTEVMKNLGISYGKFAKFIADEKKYNLARSTGNMTIPNVSRSKYIMLMRNKQIHSGNLSAVL